MGGYDGLASTSSGPEIPPQFFSGPLLLVAQDIGGDVADNVEPIVEEALDNLREATRASADHTE
jgi:hypothetical protein